VLGLCSALLRARAGCSRHALASRTSRTPRSPLGDPRSAGSRAFEGERSGSPSRDATRTLARVARTLRVARAIARALPSRRLPCAVLGLGRKPWHYCATRTANCARAVSSTRAAAAAADGDCKAASEPSRCARRLQLPPLFTQRPCLAAARDCQQSASRSASQSSEANAARRAAAQT